MILRPIFNILRRRYLELEVPRFAVTAKGRFKVLKYKCHGDLRVLVHETPWFDNLILDSGLNRWGSGAIIAGAAIGTSTTPPAVGQTGLLAQTTYTTTTGTGHNVISAAGASPYNNTRTFVYRTAVGALNGNYTEVGVGWASGSMFSRALIVDGGGTPTSLAVAPDEQLDIVYQLSVYPPLTDIAPTVTLDGVTYNVTGRACNVNAVSTTVQVAWDVEHNAAISLTGGSVWSGGISAVTASTPSGISPTGPSYSSAAYSSGSYTRNGTQTYSLTQGNVSGGFRSVTAGWGGSFGFQYEFDALVPKDGTKTMTLDFSVTWARRP